jgi:serine/threonine-protein kinase
MRQPIGSMPVREYGKYMLVRKLAEGGMAEIFLAKQVGVEGFEKNVVIKRMLPHLSEVPDFVSMFLDEARLAATLSHPNVVQISDLGFADGCYFICMEYLAGEDFAAVIRVMRRRNMQVPLHITLRVLADAAAGLHYAHEATDQRGNPLNLVHRDVSPSNIFITYSGQVKMLDFGIAKAESRASTTSAGVVKGKYQYMSPEQGRGESVDRRSDVFSLGVSLYEALTGQRPFVRDSDLAVLKAVLEGQYEPVRLVRPDLPLEVESIVTRAMALEREHRFESALEFSTEIDKYLSSGTSSGGSRVLGEFMRSTFGEERTNSKLRIETLDELVSRGVDVPGRENPTSPKTDPGALIADEPVPATDGTRAIGPPLTVAKEQQKRQRTLVLGVVGALLLGIGGTYALTRPTPVGPSLVVDAGVVVAPVPVPVVVDAGPAVVAPPVPTAVDAGGLVTSDAGLKASAPVPARPISLTAAIVSKGISQNKGRIQACFKDHKADLPSSKGVIVVKFAIASTGKVTEATTDLPNTGVSRCIEAVVKSIGYPRHVDQEVRVPIQLEYDVSSP